MAVSWEVGEPDLGLGNNPRVVRRLFLESVVLHWLLSASVGRVQTEAIGFYEVYTEPEIMGGQGQHVITV